MSNLNVTIDYVKIAQWLKMIKFYEHKIEVELDRAVVEGGNVIPNRRNGDRRNGGVE